LSFIPLKEQASLQLCQGGPPIIPSQSGIQIHVYLLYFFYLKLYLDDFSPRCPISPYQIHLTK
ncbi:hypothetical protein NAH08_12570, partial [Francisella tularensis subsp. holarctica]|nr:hypothetical protein [Francisella tularensis subsp. holarctica]